MTSFFESAWDLRACRDKQDELHWAISFCVFKTCPHLIWLFSRTLRHRSAVKLQRYSVDCKSTHDFPSTSRWVDNDTCGFHAGWGGVGWGRDHLLFPNQSFRATFPQASTQTHTQFEHSTMLFLSVVFRSTLFSYQHIFFSNFSRNWSICNSAEIDVAGRALRLRLSVCFTDFPAFIVQCRFDETL